MRFFFINIVTEAYWIDSGQLDLTRQSTYQVIRP